MSAATGGSALMHSTGPRHPSACASVIGPNPLLMRGVEKLKKQKDHHTYGALFAV